MMPRCFQQWTVEMFSPIARASSLGDPKRRSNRSGVIFMSALIADCIIGRQAPFLHFASGAQTNRLKKPVLHFAILLLRSVLHYAIPSFIEARLQGETRMATKAAEKIQSVRLTEDMRRDITAALLAHKLEKREAAHVATSAKLALRIYQHAFSAADRRKMQELPEGWLPTCTHIDVRMGGEFHRFNFGVADKAGKWPSQRFPSVRKSEDFIIEVRSDIGQAIAAYRDETAALKEARNELKAKASGILSSVTTTARLAEVWPEVVAFIPKYVPRQLPAVRRDELNAAFGLRAA